MRNEYSATVVALYGELDLASYPYLEQAVEQALSGAAGLVVLDLDELEFVDISGARAILRCHDRLRELGRELALTNLGPGITRLLELADDLEVLRVIDAPADEPGPH